MSTRVDAQRAKLLELVDRQEEDVAKTLGEIAAIPADGTTGEGYPEAVALLRRKLTDAGLKVEAIEIPTPYLERVWGKDLEKTAEYIAVRRFTGRTIVFGRRPGSKSKDDSLHLTQHYDLPKRLAASLAARPLEITDGRLSGAGVSFCRAGIAAMLAALKAISLAGVELGGDLYASFTPDNHLGGESGAGYLVEQGYGKSRRVITGSEGGPERIVLGYKGALWLKITTRGTSVAASAPHQGINAIDKMAKIQRALEALAERLAKKTTRWPSLPRESAGPTLVCSQIQSSGWGIPDRCVLFVDRRVLPEETLSEAVGEIAEILRSLQEEDKELTAEMETIHAVEPAATDPGKALPATLARNVQEVLGTAPHTALHAYYTDFRLFTRHWDAEAVNYGPGRADRAPGTPEHVLVSDVVSAAKVLALTVRDLLPA